ncbi:DNA topoisomerase IB [Mesonia ostreae]|uniref:DNA topoisomerase n=1 Tax=Mesonia ostreae TaxID=861110 RepID=A0ABU2KM73_9FLAO|nr:DNA topoisomerase IB [Mesonia ostreae]MDT0295820.1 DNA topoisomerase IB [Mesonia ostreae]
MRLSPQQLKKIIQEPEEFTNLAQLRYVSDEDLSISRHKAGKGFYYKDKKGNTISSDKEKARIKALVIPPNWKDVRITPLKNGHLQVVGRDDKDRKVYLYHETWNTFKNQTKFYKIAAFGQQLPKIRKQIDSDLKKKGMPKEKVLALVIRLMEETHIRIGNHYYAKKNQTYGLSTLRSKHVHISKDILRFDFIGKKGKEHQIDITDKKLIELVQNCEEISGWELFKYYDDDGQKQVIDSTMVNEYIQESCGDFYSAKDFRTWAATKIFFETLRDLGLAEEEKQQQKNLNLAYKETAEALGNTKSVCKEYYVHPIIPEKYLDGSISKYFDKVDKNTTARKNQLSKTEEVLLDLMKSFEIDFKN